MLPEEAWVQLRCRHESQVSLWNHSGGTTRAGLADGRKLAAASDAGTPVRVQGSGLSCPSLERGG